MNTNYNNLYSDYIGASGTYSITDYIDNTSNLLSSNIKTTSNILDTKINTTSNQITNYFNKLIDNYQDNGIFNNALNTHIYNSNILGEIRFFTNGAPSYFGNNLNFITKIQEDGQLAVYYMYNPLYPTVLGPKWYVIADVVRDTYAFQATTTTLLGSIQVEINGLLGSVNGLEVALTSTNNSLIETIAEVKMIENSLGYLNINNMNTLTAQEIQQTIEFARTSGYFNVFNNASIAGFSTLSIIGIGASAIGSVLYTNYISQQQKILSNMNNSNITTTEQEDFVNQMEIINVSNVSNYTVNNCNLNIASGFINSNILTQQLIPNLITSNINLLNQGSINGVGTAYINVCQTNFLSTSLNTNVGFPTSNLTGGTGDKLLLRYGSPNTYPISIGIDENYSLWNSINYNNTNTAFNWYIDSNIKMSLKNNRLDVNTIIYQNGKSLQTYTQETILFYTPNVSKKYGFNFSCATPIIITGTTYYKYDIDLRTYTSTKPAVNINTPYRFFTIRLYLASAYFEIMVNNTYNVLSYEISMSNEFNAGTLGGQIGINILAHHIGNTPSNPLLVNILPSYFTLMRTSDFNYLSVISTVQNINLNCIIEDLLF